MHPMKSSASGSGNHGPAVSAENWATITSYVEKLGQEAEQLRRQLETTKAHLPGHSKPKLNRLSAFFGKQGTVDAWAAHMDMYVSSAPPSEALLLATSYLQGEAFSWWQTCMKSDQDKDWPSLREALKLRFNPLNKVQAAQDLLH